MTDFVQGFWDAVLMVRDNGGGANPNVEFWFYAGNQSVNFGFVTFEKRVNNVTTSFTVGIPAYAGWIKVSTDNAIWSQYVTFQLDTNLSIFINGTPGPNYPYSYTVHLARPTVPDPPGRPYCYNVTVNALYIDWEDGYNGGATILGYQVGYGQNSSGPTTIVAANHPTTLSNLPTGTVTYFWVRAQNYQGWGNWSVINSERTYLGAYIKIDGVWKLAIPYVNAAGTWKEAEPHIRANGVWT